MVREGDAAIRENAPEMFRAMIESEEISRERVGDFVEELMSFRWLQEYIEDTLEEIQSFSINGETYREILTLLYLGDKVYDSEVVKDMVGYCHSTFHNKKKISILLLGVLFWKKMLTHWNNSIEAMYAIEIQEGRDGSISERRKTITDRRCGVPDRRKVDRRVMGDRRVSAQGIFEPY